MPRLRILRLSLLPVLLLLLAACHKQVQAPIPGAINTFDSNTYRALSVAQASINSFKNDPSFPSIVAAHPQVKTILNQAITDYNAANALYQAWKASAGANPTAPVQAAIDKMNTDVSQLATAGGSK